jgi:excinuclease ABC subunit A
LPSSTWARIIGNAVAAVERSLRSDNERIRRLVQRFLVTRVCSVCHGAHFNDATLAVRVDGLTVADVLGLSVHDALERFAGRPPVAAALRPVSEVGLGYLRLGEPTPSLSGGESQRLRIASRLRSSQRGTLYVFDEPSTGLHPLDVATLAGVFGRLLDAGATIIVIDHDLDLLAAADHLIDMGPGGGPDGGRILAAGTPEDVARAPGSATGPWLAEHLGPPGTAPRIVAATGGPLPPEALAVT